MGGTVVLDFEKRYVYKHTKFFKYMAQDINCGLCDAVKEEYRIISKNEHAIALAIKFPLMKYHALVLPIKHVTDFSTLSPEQSYSFLNLLGEFKNKMDEKLSCSSIGILNGNKFITQEHLHFQLYPIKDGARTMIASYLSLPKNKNTSIIPVQYTATEKELEHVAQTLKW